MYTPGALTVLSRLVAPNFLESEEPKFESGILGCYAGIFVQGKGQEDGIYFLCLLI